MPIQQQIINVGTAPNDGLGDPIRTAFQKTNDNFTVLFNIGGVSGITNGTSNVSIPVANSTINFAVGNVANIFQVLSNGSITTGNHTVSNYLNAGNVNVTGTILANGTIQSLGGVTAVTVTASGNLVGGNVNITNQVRTSTLLVTGNVVNSELNVTGNVNNYNLNATGNIIGQGSLLSITGFSANAGAVTAGNITGSYFIGNGSQLTGVTAAPANIFNTINANGTAVVARSPNDTVSFITNSNNLIITGASNVAVRNVYFDFSNSPTFTGTVTSTGFVGDIKGSVFADDSSLMVNAIDNQLLAQTVLAGNITATGNVTGGNITTAGLITATGNVTGGNITTAGLITATGNITSTANVSGSYILGNGSQLTGISAAVSVSKITNGTSEVAIRTSGGNIYANVGGVANVFGITTIGANVTGNLGVSGNISSGNVINTGLISSTGNVTGGNVTTAGQLISTQTGNSTTGAGQLYLNGTGNNRIEFNTAGLGVPDATTRSAGTKIVLYPLVDGSGVDYAIGTASGVVWFSVHDTARSFAWYANTTAVATLSGTGNLSATGNVTANYFLGNGACLTGVITSVANINSGTSNVTVVSAGGNVTIGVGGTGNVAVFSTTGANIASNITANNVSVTTSLSVATATIGNILNQNANGVGNIGNSGTYFNTVFAKATSAQYADLAEAYMADFAYEPGTVLSIGGRAEVTMSIFDSDPAVIGVVSTNPAYRMNDGLEGKNVVMVALVGRVPAYVNGPVRRGELMVSGGNGRLRSELNPKVGTVVGKALENFDGESGIVEVLIGRN